MSSSLTDVNQTPSNTVSEVASFCKEHKFMIGFAIVSTIFLVGVITAAFITSGQHTTPAFKAEVIAPAIGIPLVCAGFVATIAYKTRDRGTKKEPIQTTTPDAKKQATPLKTKKRISQDGERLLADGTNGNVEQIDLNDKE